MLVFFFTLAAAVALAHGHGRVLEPAGRGTAWRAGFNARANYDDDGLNCGGYYRHHTENGGNCGLCGDAYDDARPRAHERGGIYDSGIIVGTYEAGSVIPITVEITANHLGYWQFKLCADPTEPDQECFDENILELEEGGTKYYPTEGSKKYYVNYRLPEGVTCEACTLQWRYTCGNNWGRCSNGTEGLGCGDQENFGACSDIAIVGNPDAPQFIEVESLLLQKVDQQDVIKLLLNAAKVPPRWVETNSLQPQKQRLNSKKPRTKGINFIEHKLAPYTSNKKVNYRKKNKQRRKNKRKKKVAPRKVKWMGSPLW